MIFLFFFFSNITISLGALSGLQPGQQLSAAQLIQLRAGQRQKFNDGFVKQGQTCGRDNESPSSLNRIRQKLIGGNDAKLSTAVWMCQVRCAGISCGGSLVSPMHLITAQHCFPSLMRNLINVESSDGLGFKTGSDFQDWLDPDDRTGKPAVDCYVKCNTEQGFEVPITSRTTRTAKTHLNGWREVVEVFVPNMSRFTNSKKALDDLMIVQLDRPLKLEHLKDRKDWNVGSVCLPPIKKPFQRISKILNRPVRMLGWGLDPNVSKIFGTRTLQEATTTIHKIDHENNTLHTTVFKNQLGVKVDVCRGDSGGGVYVENWVDGQKFTYIIGVLSEGWDCASNVLTTSSWIYLPPYMDWILSVLNLDTCQTKQQKHLICSNEGRQMKKLVLNTPCATFLGQVCDAQNCCDQVTTCETAIEANANLCIQSSPLLSRENKECNAEKNPTKECDFNWCCAPETCETKLQFDTKYCSSEGRESGSARQLKTLCNTLPDKCSKTECCSPKVTCGTTLQARVGFCSFREVDVNAALNECRNNNCTLDDCCLPETCSSKMLADPQFCQNRPLKKSMSRKLCNKFSDGCTSPNCCDNDITCSAILDISDLCTDTNQIPKDDVETRLCSANNKNNFICDANYCCKPRPTCTTYIAETEPTMCTSLLSSMKKSFRNITCVELDGRKCDFKQCCNPAPTCKDKLWDNECENKGKMKKSGYNTTYCHQYKNNNCNSNTCCDEIPTCKMVLEKNPIFCPSKDMVKDENKLGLHCVNKTEESCTPESCCKRPKTCDTFNREGSCALERRTIDESKRFVRCSTMGGCSVDNCCMKGETCGTILKKDKRFCRRNDGEDLEDKKSTECYNFLKYECDFKSCCQRAETCGERDQKDKICEQAGLKPVSKHKKDKICSRTRNCKPKRCCGGSATCESSKLETLCSGYAPKQGNLNTRCKRFKNGEGCTIDNCCKLCQPHEQLCPDGTCKSRRVGCGEDTINCGKHTAPSCEDCLTTPSYKSSGSRNNLKCGGDCKMVKSQCVLRVPEKETCAVAQTNRRLCTGDQFNPTKQNFTCTTTQCRKEECCRDNCSRTKSSICPRSWVYFRGTCTGYPCERDECCRKNQSCTDAVSNGLCTVSFADSPLQKNLGRGSNTVKPKNRYRDIVCDTHECTFQECCKADSGNISEMTETCAQAQQNRTLCHSNNVNPSTQNTICSGQCQYADCCLEMCEDAVPTGICRPQKLTKSIPLQKSMIMPTDDLPGIPKSPYEGIRCQTNVCTFDECCDLADSLVLGSPTGGSCEVKESKSNTQKECKFPFIYKNISYSACTNIDENSKNSFWCSTRVDGNGVHLYSQGYWGECGQECRACNVKEDASDIVKKCIFPFHYKSNTYYSCTNIEENNPTDFWCSTETVEGTINHKTNQGKWGFCKQNCPRENSQPNHRRLQIITNDEHETIQRIMNEANKEGQRTQSYLDAAAGKSNESDNVRIPGESSEDKKDDRVASSDSVDNFDDNTEEPIIVVGYDNEVEDMDAVPSKYETSRDRIDSRGNIFTTNILRTCLLYPCPHGISLQNAEKIKCGDSECTQEKCCPETCGDRLAKKPSFCPDSKSMAQAQKYSDTICVGVKCTVEECCYERCTQRLRENPKFCPNQLRNNVHNIICAGVPCEVQECCGDTCGNRYAQNSNFCPYNQYRYNLDNRVCNGVHCEPYECCYETCQQRLEGVSNFCPSGHTIQNPENKICMGVECFIDDCCVDTCHFMMERNIEFCPNGFLKNHEKIICDGEECEQYECCQDFQTGRLHCNSNTDCLLNMGYNFMCIRGECKQECRSDLQCPNDEECQFEKRKGFAQFEKRKGFAHCVKKKYEYEILNNRFICSGKSYKKIKIIKLQMNLIRKTCESFCSRRHHCTGYSTTRRKCYLFNSRLKENKLRKNPGNCVKKLKLNHQCNLEELKHLVRRVEDKELIKLCHSADRVYNDQIKEGQSCSFHYNNKKIIVTCRAGKWRQANGKLF